jgi:hypothetical protein
LPEEIREMGIVHDVKLSVLEVRIGVPGMRQISWGDFLIVKRVAVDNMVMLMVIHDDGIG